MALDRLGRPTAGTRQRTARRARMTQAATTQRQALAAGPAGFMGTQRLSNANRVARRLLGGTSNQYGLAGPGGGGGAGGGGAGGGYGADYDEARESNLRRYKDILSGYSDRYKRGVGTLDQIGAQEKADIIRRGKNRATVGQQDRISRGLTGSTIDPAAGYARETEAELRRSSEGLARLRLGTDASLSGDYLQFAERHKEPYPDLGQYRSAYQAYGASGAGGGGGYDVIGGGYGNLPYGGMMATGGGSGQPRPPRFAGGGGRANFGPPQGDAMGPDHEIIGGGGAQPIRPGGQQVARGGGLEDIQRGRGLIPGLPPHLQGLSREELLRRFPNLIRQLEGGRNNAVTRGYV